MSEAQAKGKAEGEAKQWANVVAHMFSDQTEAFRHFLASRDQDLWPETSEVLT